MWPMGHRRGRFVGRRRAVPRRLLYCQNRDSHPGLPAPAGYLDRDGAAERGDPQAGARGV